MKNKIFFLILLLLTTILSCLSFADVCSQYNVNLSDECGYLSGGSINIDGIDYTMPSYPDFVYGGNVIVNYNINNSFSEAYLFVKTQNDYYINVTHCFKNNFNLTFIVNFTNSKYDLYCNNTYISELVTYDGMIHCFYINWTFNYSDSEIISFEENISAFSIILIVILVLLLVISIIIPDISIYLGICAFFVSIAIVISVI